MFDPSHPRPGYWAADGTPWLGHTHPSQPLATCTGLSPTSPGVCPLRVHPSGLRPVPFRA